MTRNVKIFYGKGNPQSEGGVTFAGWNDIEQWFIPGLGERVSVDTGTRTQLSAKGQSVINVYRTVSLRSAMISARSFH